MIYIDNSATTKQYPQVTETMMKYMEEYFGNPSSMYQLGLDSEKAVKHARKQVEEAMGAGNGTLIFTSGGQKRIILPSLVQQGRCAVVETGSSRLP